MFQEDIIEGPLSHGGWRSRLRGVHARGRKGRVTLSSGRLWDKKNPTRGLKTNRGQWKAWRSQGGLTKVVATREINGNKSYSSSANTPEKDSGGRTGVTRFS